MNFEKNNNKKNVYVCSVQKLFLCAFGWNYECTSLGYNTLGYRGLAALIQFIRIRRKLWNSSTFNYQSSQNNQFTLFFPNWFSLQLQNISKNVDYVKRWILKFQSLANIDTETYKKNNYRITIFVNPRSHVLGNVS